VNPEPAEPAVLRQLEERLLDSSVRKSPQELAALLADDFVEFGASGRVFDKRQIIDSLQGERPVTLSLTDFRATLLAPGVMLTTYRITRHADSERAAGNSLRSSIWKLLDGRWQMVFHQGTPTGEPVGP
jgi:hypothetical protein